MSEPLYVADEPAPRARSLNRRTMLIGGGLGALVLAAAGYLVLSGGGASSGTGALPVAVHVVGTRPTTTAIPAPTPIVAPIVDSGRDPFQALIATGSAGTSQGGAPVALPTSSDSGSSTGSSTSPQAPTTTAPSGTTTSYTLTLVTVGSAGGAASLTWKVDGTTVTTSGTDTFGKYNEMTVQSVTGGVVTVQKNALRPFQMHAGDSVKVL